jgi:hypothetical protein
VKENMKIKNLAGGILAVSTAMMLIAPAHADEFASFDAAKGSTITFTNSGSTSTLTDDSNAQFEYTVANLTGQTYQEIPVNIAFSGTVSGVATTGGPDAFQDLQDVSLSVSVDPTFAASHASEFAYGDNLLSFTNGTAYVQGAIGGKTADATADTQTKQVLGFSSDYLYFQTNSEETFTLDINSLTHAMGIAPNGYLKSFSGTPSGNFGATPTPTIATPEPGTVTGFLLGVFGLAALLVRGKRTRALQM